ncbi:SRPBCC family protein [Blastococcus sp. SYSU D00820]
MTAGALPEGTTATGSRVVAEPRARVWQALAVLAPYCAVCDVSYVVEGGRAPGRGTRFVCVPGRLDGTPPAGAPQGEITEWQPRRSVTTRLDLTPEVWTTRVDLADDDGGTRVTVTVTQQPRTSPRLIARLQRGSMKRLVQRMVDGELDKLPEHLAQLDQG